MFSNPIYNDKGLLIDWSDNNEQAEKIVNEVDFNIFLSKLEPRERRVIQLKLAGYTHREIAKRTRISYHQIQEIVEKVKVKYLKQNQA